MTSFEELIICLHNLRKSDFEPKPQLGREVTWKKAQNIADLSLSLEQKRLNCLEYMRQKPQVLADLVSCLIRASLSGNISEVSRTYDELLLYARPTATSEWAAREGIKRREAHTLVTKVQEESKNGTNDSNDSSRNP